MNQLTTQGSGELRGRGSKFLAFAFVVFSREEVRAVQAGLRKEYFDAQHHCYAYRLGKQGETAFANDDGEPKHSAGDPILGQIRARDLTNVLVVVIRYFGGTLLGVRGLIDAYKGVSAQALDACTITEIIPQFVFRLTFPYARTSEVSRLLNPFPTQIIEQSFTDICVQTFAVRSDLSARVCSAFEGTWVKFEEISCDL